MNIKIYSMTTTRHFTNLILDLVEQGLIDKNQVILNLLNWMNESDVKCFWEHCGYDEIIENSEED